MTNPVDVGNEVAAVDQYTCLQNLVRVVNSANNLMEALDNAGAVQKMEEVRSGLISRQEEMRKRYERSGVDYLVQAWNQMKDDGLSEASLSQRGGSKTSLSSDQV